MTGGPPPEASLVRLESIGGEGEGLGAGPLPRRGALGRQEGTGRLLPHLLAHAGEPQVVCGRGTGHGEGSRGGVPRCTGVDR